MFKNVTQTRRSILTILTETIPNEDITAAVHETTINK